MLLPCIEPSATCPSVQAPAAGPTLLSRIVKLHYNWKYLFLRPTIKEIVDRYNTKFRPTKTAAEAGPSSST